MPNFLIVVFTLVLALFLFGLTVFVHEFGHYLVARLCRLKVLTFSIGFGKAIVSWERNGIVYKIGWIPFGGYVALPQLDPEGMERIQGGKPVKHEPVSPWKKIAVSVAGPLGNILFASLIAIIIWLVPGDEAGSKIRPVIGSVETNSAAYAAGLQRGDTIQAVNGTSVSTWYDYSVETLLKGNEFVSLTIRSGDDERDVSLPVVDRGGGERLVEGLYPALPCVFGRVNPDSPAERAGVLQGDEVLTFNGEVVVDWQGFTERVQAMSEGETAELTVLRDENTEILRVTPGYNAEYERMMIGVQLGGGSGFPWMNYKNPVDQLKHDALMIVRLLQALTNREEAGNAVGGMGAAVSIMGMLMQAIRMGFLNTIGFVRFLNVNLAILNLLPIPVLDGGHIVFSLWEGITRRKVNARVQTILINICAVLLITAMVLLTINDIDRQLPFKKHVRNFFSGQTEAVEDVVPVDAE